MVARQRSAPQKPTRIIYREDEFVYQLIKKNRFIRETNLENMGRNVKLDKLVATQGPTAGQFPAKFPKNHADLLTWKDDQVTELLRFYSVYIHPNSTAAERKVQLFGAIC